MDRRLGARRTVGWLDLRWLARRTGWRARLVEERVAALDVSTSGVGIRAGAVADLRIGHVVTLRLDPFEVRATIRRIMPAEDATSVLYGLEFIDPPPTFLEALLVQGSQARHEPLELVWRHRAA
jgi:hypothetical protein